MRNSVMMIVLTAATLHAEPSVTVEQVTRGPAHHFFGYIGQCRTVPWSPDGRWIVGLRTKFQDHMPLPGERADVVLLDTTQGNRLEAVETTGAWNFQQGTMFYWVPAPGIGSQFIFNDRDDATGRVFAVLYDAAARQRVREYRFDDVPVGNGGVCQTGGKFAAINYGRLARLRLVTGYPGALDATREVKQPDNDGIFVVDIATGERKLLVSYAQMAKAAGATAERDLFVNHTLWSRGGERLYFFVRADFYDKAKKLDVPMVVDADGSNLTALPQHFGGHPDWLDDHRMIGRDGDKQAIYDVVAKKYVGELGGPDVFPNPGGDVAVSPDGKWLVNGYHSKNQTLYVFLRFSDGLVVRSPPLSNGGVTSGDLRIDPAPCWNRTSDAVLVPAMAGDGTRQMFLVSLRLGD